MAKKPDQAAVSADTKSAGADDLWGELAKADAENPKRYSTLKEIYGLESADSESEPESVVEQCYRYLAWAIEKEKPGFGVDGKISVSAAARGFGVSRNTVAQAVERLVESGQLEERPKAPYRILSAKAVMPEPWERMARKVSVTRELGGPYQGGDAVARLSKSRADSVEEYKRITEKRDHPRYREELLPDEEVRVFTRIRFLPEQDEGAGERRIWWIEQTLLKLPDDIAAKFDRRLRALVTREVGRVSLTDELRHAGVQSLCAERNLVRIKDPGEKLRKAVQELVDSWYLPGKPPKLPDWTGGFLRLSCCQYSSRPPGLCALTICYLTVNHIDLFVHDFRLPNDLRWLD
jgi:DNA-binding Lrp family transcriptional regulator